MISGSVSLSFSTASRTSSNCRQTAAARVSSLKIVERLDGPARKVVHTFAGPAFAAARQLKELLDLVDRQDEGWRKGPEPSRDTSACVVSSECRISRANTQGGTPRELPTVALRSLASASRLQVTSRNMRQSSRMVRDQPCRQRLDVEDGTVAPPGSRRPFRAEIGELVLPLANPVARDWIRQAPPRAHRTGSSPEAAGCHMRATSEHARGSASSRSASAPAAVPCFSDRCSSGSRKEGKRCKAKNSGLGSPASIGVGFRQTQRLIIGNRQHPIREVAEPEHRNGPNAWTWRAAHSPSRHILRNRRQYLSGCAAREPAIAPGRWRRSLAAKEVWLWHARQRLARPVSAVTSPDAPPAAWGPLVAQERLRDQSRGRWSVLRRSYSSGVSGARIPRRPASVWSGECLDRIDRLGVRRVIADAEQHREVRGIPVSAISQASPTSWAATKEFHHLRGVRPSSSGLATASIVAAVAIASRSGCIVASNAGASSGPPQISIVDGRPTKALLTAGGRSAKSSKTSKPASLRIPARSEASSWHGRGRPMRELVESGLAALAFEVPSASVQHCATSPPRRVGSGPAVVAMAGASGSTRTSSRQIGRIRTSFGPCFPGGKNRVSRRTGRARPSRRRSPPGAHAPPGGYQVGEVGIVERNLLPETSPSPTRPPLPAMSREWPEP